jgi:hypothetical protein
MFVKISNFCLNIEFLSKYRISVTFSEAQAVSLAFTHHPFTNGPPEALGRLAVTCENGRNHFKKYNPKYVNNFLTRLKKLAS